MKADFTRSTFDRAKHYRAVQQQQGRVQLDADWNELNDITSYRVETETIDVVGACGAPIYADGFRLISNAAQLTADEQARAGNKNLPVVLAGDLLITAGRFYARGVLSENELICLVSSQPEYPKAAEISKVGATALFPLAADGTYLAYLDVWPRLRNAIDDPDIREVALGGPDTATRAKTTWQVKFLAAAAGANCATANAEWDALLNSKFGTLAASVAKTASKNDPCIVDPGSSYRRLENQLYRVEVHIGGSALSKATFKWSRDNGSIVTRWLSKKVGEDELEVETTGRDKVLNIAPGHWVELIDDVHEELGLPGTLAVVTKVSGTRITINSANATGPVEFADFPRNPKVRRWDAVSTKTGKWVAPDGEKTLNTTDTFELEDGIVVQFGAGNFRTGDYWLIPARTALPFVGWPTTGAAKTPVQLPPHGVPHWYCKLAIVEYKAGVFKITDCRSLFPPLTDFTSLFYVSGDSQFATPDPLNASQVLPLALPLTVGIANGELPKQGARVRFSITDAGGALTPGPGGNIISPTVVESFTDAAGLAICHWSIDSTTNAPKVTAELLDPSGARVHLPVIFHARLNTAKVVSYDPKNCVDMKNTGVVTVQDALDFLCHEEADVECCVTIGQLGEDPGDYKTIADAIKDLHETRHSISICLNLLPGDHIIDKDLLIKLVSHDAPYFKIEGCSHASRLVLQAPLIFQKLAGVVIRDISIVVQDAYIEFQGCNEVEVSMCIVIGRPPNSALLRFIENKRVTVNDNDMTALGTSKPSTPATVFAGINALSNVANVFSLVDNQDFLANAPVAAAEIAKLPLRERKTIARNITAALDAAGGPATEEKNAYRKLITTLNTDRPTAKTVTERFSTLRVAGASAAQVGAALALLDVTSFASLINNRINGLVSFGGPAVALPFTADQIQKFEKKTFRLSPSGSLRVRGNWLRQVSADSPSVDALKKVINNSNTADQIPVWGSVHFTDNIIADGANFFFAAHLSLSATRFLETKQDLGLAVCKTAAVVANSDDQDVRLFTVARAAQLAANVGINIIVIPSA